MSWIEDIRNRLGWSQADLAVYLGISRSIVALAETNRRSLSTDAVLRLSRLSAQAAMPVDVAVQQQVAQMDNTAAQAATVQLTRRLKTCEWELMKMHKQLQAAETAFSQAMQCLQWMAQEQVSNPDLMPLIEVLRLKAHARLRQNGPTARRQLQHAIRLLDYEVLCLKEWLSGKVD